MNIREGITNWRGAVSTKIEPSERERVRKGERDKEREKERARGRERGILIC